MRWSWLFVLATVSVASADRKVIADRVAAVVNDQVILVSELDLRMLPLRVDAAKIADPTERERRIAKLATQMLDEMIDDELVVQAAAAAKLTVDADEVKQALDYIKKTNKLDDKQLAEEMRKQGVTQATIKNDILRQRAINQILGPKVVVTDEDTRRRYDEQMRRAASVTGVNVDQLVFAADDKGLAAARARARRVVERVTAGEPFAKVADEAAHAPRADTEPTALYTDHVWLDAGTVIPDLEPVVFGMEKGDVRGPIEVAGAGIYVLYANELRRTQLKPYADLKEQLAVALRQEGLDRQRRAWIEELRKKAYIDIKLR